eukprot:14305949-Alexandrium_andersonii.AAC.1
MSASLVGSEMCIRDRPPSWPRWARRWPRQPAGGRTECRASGPAVIAMPVSYTHLTLPTICSV